MYLSGIHKHIIVRVRLFLLLMAFLFSAFKPVSEGNEYEIKAMFIFNFTKYVEWPETKNADEFIIGVYGESEILEPLEKIAAQKKVNDKRIVIKQLSADDEQYCNMIIVSRLRLGK